jgi:replicative DNA helicase
VIVDYLQLIRPLSKTYNREQEISTISRELKKAALTEQVAIIALSQLNREAEEKEPKLSHLRESGALEQDADVVILPFRPVDYGVDAAPNLLKLKVEKNRRGLLTQINLYHNLQMTDFSENNYFQPIKTFTKQSPNNCEPVF